MYVCTYECMYVWMGSACLGLTHYMEEYRTTRCSLIHNAFPLSAVFVRHIDPYPAMDDDSDEPLFQKLLIPSDSYTYIYIFTLIHSIYIHNYVYIPVHILYRLYLFAWSVAFPWHQLSTRFPWRKTAPRCWSWASNSFAHGGRGPAGPDPGSTV